MKSFVPAMHISSVRAAIIAGLALASSMVALAQEPVKIPMTADRWETTDNATFETDAAYPLGVMTVTKGVAVLKDFNFRNGTIEFDVIPRGRWARGSGFGGGMKTPMKTFICGQDPSAMRRRTAFNMRRKRMEC
jgi:hypothetical protein